MKISGREDVEAPIDFVFGQISDFASLERSAMRRGAEITRMDALTSPGPGMIWDTRFDFRGKRRQFKLELISHEPPNGMRFSASSPAILGDVTVDLVALSRGRTRINLEFDIQPRTLSSRLLVQSLKLAKGNVTKRFEMRMASFARDLEDRYARQT
jgi:hypothetical protein